MKLVQVIENTSYLSGWKIRASRFGESAPIWDSPVHFGSMMSFASSVNTRLQPMRPQPENTKSAS